MCLPKYLKEKKNILERNIESFPFESRKETKMPTINTFLFNVISCVLVIRIQKQRRQTEGEGEEWECHYSQLIWSCIEKIQKNSSINYQNLLKSNWISNKVAGIKWISKNQLCPYITAQLETWNCARNKSNKKTYRTSKKTIKHSRTPNKWREST